MPQRLFGTDGIRGNIVPANPDEKASLAALHKQRSVCPTLMRLVGEALGHLIDKMPGEGEHVVIGWDERPGNKELVAGITLGLRLAGCKVTHIGVCATPALHYAVLWHNARIGCMMTASHILLQTRESKCLMPMDSKQLRKWRMKSLQLRML